MGLQYRNPGLGFYLYSLIVFIIMTLTYVEYVRASVLELSFYVTISTAIGTTLQFLSTISTSLKAWRTIEDHPFLTKLATSNLGVFFYGYSIILLWTSIPIYILKDYGTYISLTQFGILSTFIGLYLHITSNMLSKGKRNLASIIFATMISTISSTILFYNVLAPLPLKPLQKVLISSGYLATLTLSYLAAFKITGSMLAGFASMILVAVSPATITLARSGDYSSMIFSATYIALFILIFHLMEIRYATPLALMVLAIQVVFSKAYLLSVMLAIVALLSAPLREKHYNYAVYVCFFMSLAVLFYILIFPQKILNLILKTSNIYYIVCLTISTCLSIALFLDKDAASSLRISTASIPLLFGIPFFFKESYITLIYIAILASSFLTTYLSRSISVERAGQEEVEVTIVLDGFLIFSPIILLLATSMIP